MKAVRIVPVLLLLAAASAAYVWLRPSSDTPPVADSIALPGERQMEVPVAAPPTNEVQADAKAPVQPLEERGDAMLFEIDALQNTPFDEAIVQPFD